LKESVACVCEHLSEPVEKLKGYLRIGGIDINGGMQSPR
jgi:hypothetical protein